MNEIPETLDKVIQVLADKFGKTGKELWSVIVLQQRIRGACQLVGTVSLLIAAAYFIPALAGIPACGDYDANCQISTVFGWGLALAIFPVVAWWIYGAATNLLNSNYAAIKDILNTI